MVSQTCVATVARRLPAILSLAALLSPATATAQAPAARFDASAQVTVTRSGQFDDTDLGLGGRFAWHPSALLGVEAEYSHYSPGTDLTPAFTLPRHEALFGVTAGPRLGRARVFARARAGVLTYDQVNERILCIAIYPPPLACVLAAGHTLAAFDLGGGIELPLDRRWFVRFDAGDRIVKYPGPAFDTNGEPHEGSFFGHDLRLATGIGLRLR